MCALTCTRMGHLLWQRQGRFCEFKPLLRLSLARWRSQNPVKTRSRVVFHGQGVYLIQIISRKHWHMFLERERVNSADPVPIHRSQTAGLALVFASPSIFHHPRPHLVCHLCLISPEYCSNIALYLFVTTTRAAAATSFGIIGSVVAPRLCWADRNRASPCEEGAWKSNLGC